MTQLAIANTSIAGWSITTAYLSLIVKSKFPGIASTCLGCLYSYIKNLPVCLSICKFPEKKNNGFKKQIALTDGRT